MKLTPATTYFIDNELRNALVAKLRSHITRINVGLPTMRNTRFSSVLTGVIWSQTK